MVADTIILTFVGVLVVFGFAIVLIPFAYFAWCIYHVVKRKKVAYFWDAKMFATGIILSFVNSIIFHFIDKAGLKESNYPEYACFVFLGFVYLIFTSRLLVLSYKVKEENKNTFYYRFDRWIERMYTKYLQPLW